MVVAHNLSSMNANRNLSVSTGKIKKSGEKLSSGYKINRAADDAAGLTISEKMRSQIRGLTQASANAQDGISFVQTADGTLDEVSAMLKRSKELAVKASTETLTDADRQAIQEEITSISNEIDRVQESSTFNDFRIFTEGGYPPSQTGMRSDISPVKTSGSIPVTVTLSMIGASGTTGAETDGANNFSANEQALADYVQKAASYAVEKLQAAYGGVMGQASTNEVKIGLALTNIDGVSKTLAQVEYTIVSGGGNSSIAYTLRVDTSDYVPDQIFGSMSPTQKEAKLADLAATIAHEMTHAVMVDMMPMGMAGGLPQWFKEGVAQTSSGDGGWVYRNPSDEYLRDKITHLYDNPYGTGYLAAMYLGHLAGGGDATGSSINPATIKQGLNDILTDIANGSSLSDAIKNHTGLDNLAAFESKFVNGDNNVFTFAKNFMGEVGSSGAGSLLASSLSTSEGVAFATFLVEGSTPSTYYRLDKDNKIVSNGYVGTPIPVPASESYGDGKGRDIYLQVGAANRDEQRIKVKRFDISCDSLFEGHKMDVSTAEKARETLGYIDIADANVSAVRSYYGAIQNRLEHTISNLDNVVENTTAAESQIRDTDMAKEMVDYTKTNVLIQAGNAMLTQAMQTPQNILQLLS